MEKRGTRKGLTRLNWDEREELLLGACLPVVNHVASAVLSCCARQARRSPLLKHMHVSTVSYLPS
jgi:hypothetical protein